MLSTTANHWWTGTAYPSRAPEFTPGFLVGSMLLIFLFFVVVLLCVFTFWVSCCNVRYDFLIKRYSGRLYLQLFVWGCISYLRYLCLFAYSGVQHIVCCGLFLHLVHSVCCQFLWIIIFWVPLQYYVTFICNNITVTLFSFSRLIPLL
jgi:hypothetical protein